jgi:hypothetical protein
MGDSTSVKDLERAEAQQRVEAPPLPDDFEFQAAGDNPLAIAEVLSEAGINGEPTGDVPLIEDPGPDSVTLPGGLVIDGEVYRQATVRELNGEDEEHISRAVLGNPVRFQQALLERGVVSVGPHRADEELLDKLLVGDRDRLVLGVRVATYGDTMDMDVVCSHCGVESKIRVAFEDDLPIRPLPWDAREVEHEIALRNGVAVVKLVTGAMQRYVYSLEGKTASELNTHLFTKCVVSINGEAVNGRLETVRQLGMSDRSAILDWLLENQPGPDYSAIKHACTICGKETPLDLQAEHLFPGLG